ncbi:hypothetical protein F2P79_024564 [Pimephales promelas]|nr:hypothetical protein F2P79_024564 [Pimephales promelas]
MTEVLLEDEGEITEGDCVTLTYTPTSEVKETDFELFGDGSTQVIEGKPFSLHTNHTEIDTRGSESVVISVRLRQSPLEHHKAL